MLIFSTNITDTAMEKSQNSKRQMRTFIELNAGLEKLSKELESQLKDFKINGYDIENFRKLYTNHIENFQTRCESKQRVFFHQHELMYEMEKGSDAYQTASFLKENAENKIREYGSVAKGAIEKDFKEILEEIKHRKSPHNPNDFADDQVY